MHHAKEPHDVGFHCHAFALPREGVMADRLREAFPEAYYSEDHREWRIDWDPAQFPDQGRRIGAFEAEHGIDVMHRY